MTQLDLPQVSVQRYVDLLKRRRWQVVPASLLGLLVGGLVAFFIPRFYVASTLLVHELPPGTEAPRGQEDPFRTIVETVQLTIPLAVGETIAALGWPESLAADQHQLDENIKEIRSRLTVDDGGQSKDRSYAQIHVRYLDRDGLRAANFLNTLCDTWSRQRLSEMRQKAESERSWAREKAASAALAYDQLVGERQYLEREYALDPTADPGLMREQQRAREDEQRQRRKTREEKALALAAGRRLLAEAEAERLVTERRRPRSPGARPVAGEEDPTTARLVAELLRWRQIVADTGPLHPDHGMAQRRIVELEKELGALGFGPLVDGLTEENPRYAELEATVRRLESENAVLEGQIAALDQLLAAEDERLLRLQVGKAEYDKLLARIEDARKVRDEASARARDKDEIVGRLQNQQTIKQLGKANPPPHPTEPNVLVVALIGCVLGLGCAIGLILLLDVLQATFKTVDEVERGLPVPVLGGMSHLETDAERVQVQRGRRRASMVAAAMLFLAVSVVLVYYLDPTRLPSAARDLLSLLLGK